MNFAVLLFIAIISFFGLDLLTQCVNLAMGNNPIDDNYYAIIVLGAVIICCTYLIISKLNELKK